MCEHSRDTFYIMQQFARKSIGKFPDVESADENTYSASLINRCATNVQLRFLLGSQKHMAALVDAAPVLCWLAIPLSEAVLPYSLHGTSMAHMRLILLMKMAAF